LFSIFSSKICKIQHENIQLNEHTKKKNGCNYHDLIIMYSLYIIFYTNYTLIIVLTMHIIVALTAIITTIHLRNYIVKVIGFFFLVIIYT